MKTNHEKYMNVHVKVISHDEIWTTSRDILVPGEMNIDTALHLIGTIGSLDHYLNDDVYDTFTLTDTSKDQFRGFTLRTDARVNNRCLHLTVNVGEITNEGETNKKIITDYITCIVSYYQDLIDFVYRSVLYKTYTNHSGKSQFSVFDLMEYNRIHVYLNRDKFETTGITDSEVTLPVLDVFNVDQFITSNVKKGTVKGNVLKSTLEGDIISFLSSACGLKRDKDFKVISERDNEGRLIYKIAARKGITLEKLRLGEMSKDILNSEMDLLFFNRKRMISEGQIVPVELKSVFKMNLDPARFQEVNEYRRDYNYTWRDKND